MFVSVLFLWFCFRRVCWHVDAPLPPRGCLCWQNLLLRPRFKYRRSCYRAKGFVLSEANGELCTVSHFHFLSLPVSGAQPFLFVPRTTWAKRKNWTLNLGWKPKRLVATSEVCQARPRRGKILPSHKCLSQSSNKYCPPYFLSFKRIFLIYGLNCEYFFFKSWLILHCFDWSWRRVSQSLTTRSSFLCSLKVAQQPSTPVTMTTAPARTRM